MPGEFDLIARHFTRSTRHTELGVGDDGALFSATPGNQLVVSTDMLVAGTHFFPDTEPEALGWKTAAVNISDMAAMGAAPRWMLLALALPQADEAWLAAFAAGFADCCASFDIDWIGGDTTRGPLNLCATVIGEVPQGAAISRSGARAGDELWISGTPGLAALGLRHLQGQVSLQGAARERCLAALQRPQPRVALGLALRGIASAMLDVSDGLLGDLGHILAQSRCGALIEAARLPLDEALAACGDATLARQCLLAGGDDYELLFAAPAARHAEIAALASVLGLPLSHIGQLTEDATGIVIVEADGHHHPVAARGYDHFGGNPHG